jgi:TolB-like protein
MEPGRFFLIVSILLLCRLPSKGVEVFETEVSNLTNTVAAAVEKADLKAITVANFTDLRGNDSELGRFLADEVSTKLIMTNKGFTVVDRLNFKKILKEHKMTTSGLTNPDNAKKFGQLAGVDAIIIGTATPLGDNVHVTIKVLVTDSAKLVGAALGDLPKTVSIQELLKDGVDLPEPTPTSETDLEEVPRKPSQRIPGAKLEVWTLPSDFRGDTPPGMSLGSMIDSGTLFNIGNFLTEDAFKALKRHLVAVRWSGYLEIKEQGNHNFIIEKTGNGLRGALWFVSLKVDGENIILDRSGFTGGESTDVVTKEIAGTQLGLGAHDFELFTYSLDMLNFTTFQLRVKIRSGNSQNATLIDAKSVFHRQ